jgi:hypothetical protein
MCVEMTFRKIKKDGHGYAGKKLFSYGVSRKESEALVSKASKQFSTCQVFVNKNLINLANDL